MKIARDEITLRDFEISDIENKVKWINNPENNHYLHYDIPLNIAKTRNWFLHKDNSIRQDCIIEYNKVAVGLIGLLNIDYNNQKAEYYITLGEPDYKRKGISIKATALIIEYAFFTLNLNKVYLNVDADNVAACRLYEKAGFNCEGYFRKDLNRKNELIDRKRYAILKSDIEGQSNHEFFDFSSRNEK